MSAERDAEGSDDDRGSNGSDRNESWRLQWLQLCNGRDDAELLAERAVELQEDVGAGKRRSKSCLVRSDVSIIASDIYQL